MREFIQLTWLYTRKKIMDSYWGDMYYDDFNNVKHDKMLGDEDDVHVDQLSKLQEDILNLIELSGGCTDDAVAIALGIPIEEASKTIDELIALGHISVEEIT
jgi:predicted HTH transcriptional regulator